MCCLLFNAINNVLFYIGYFDQQFRQILFTQWAAHLQQAGIQFRADLARVEVSILKQFYHCWFIHSKVNQTEANVLNLWWYCLYVLVYLKMFNKSRDDSRLIEKVQKQAGLVHNIKPQQNK